MCGLWDESPLLVGRIQKCLCLKDFGSCLGHPVILLGHPATWVKGRKCLSPFNIKATQWLVRAFPKFLLLSFFLERTLLLLPPREWLFFFLRENDPSPLHGFISALPPLLLWRPLHCRLRPRFLLFISSLLRRLVLPSRLVNLLPSVVLVLPCCVLCIVLCFGLHYCCLFCVLLGVLFCGSLSALCLFCEKAIRIDNLCWSVWLNFVIGWI